ncbi:GPI-GlcNAc transferase complex, PIG-H component-domain-containing protein [Umbelopsis sp. PMI_123]|nr:GPI-GlcNAc transferase complex, PIG-H component-domain-containing protein [Umbelopsis sp. PMI_123]
MSPSQYSLSPLTDDLSYRALPGVREYVVHSDAQIWTITSITFISLCAIFSYLLSDIVWIRWLIGCALAVWLWIKLSTIKEESILAVRNVGVQVKTTYLSGRSRSHFIERSRICDIIIHEAITMWQVKFYMAIITAKQDKMTVVFEHLLPPLNPTLITVYHGARSMIFSDTNP